MVVQLGLHRHDRRGRDGLHQALELIVLPGVCHETFSLSVTGVMKSGLREGKLPLVGGAEVAGILALPRQSLRGLGSEVCELLLVAQTVCLILGLRRLQLPLQPGFVLFAALHGLGQSPTLLLQATEGGHGRVMLPVLHGLQVGHPRSSLREQVPHPTQVLLKLVRPLLRRCRRPPQLRHLRLAPLLHPPPLLVLALQVPLQVLQGPHVGLPPALVGRPDLRPLGPLHLQLVLQVLVVILELPGLLLPLAGELRPRLGDALLGGGHLVLVPAGGVLGVRQLPAHLLRPLHRFPVGVGQRLDLRPGLPHLSSGRVLQALQLPLRVQEILLELVALSGQAEGALLQPAPLRRPLLLRHSHLLRRLPAGLVHPLVLGLPHRRLPSVPRRLPDLLLHRGLQALYLLVPSALRFCQGGELLLELRNIPVPTLLEGGHCVLVLSLKALDLRGVVTDQPGSVLLRLLPGQVAVLPLVAELLFELPELALHLGELGVPQLHLRLRCHHAGLEADHVPLPGVRGRLQTLLGPFKIGHLRLELLAGQTPRLPLLLERRLRRVLLPLQLSESCGQGPIKVLRLGRSHLQPLVQRRQRRGVGLLLPGQAELQVLDRVPHHGPLPSSLLLGGGQHLRELQLQAPELTMGGVRIVPGLLLRLPLHPAQLPGHPLHLQHPGAQHRHPPAQLLLHRSVGRVVGLLGSGQRPAVLRSQLLLHVLVLPRHLLDLLFICHPLLRQGRDLIRLIPDLLQQSSVGLLHRRQRPEDLLVGVRLPQHIPIQHLAPALALLQAPAQHGVLGGGLLRHLGQVALEATEHVPQALPGATQAPGLVGDVQEQAAVVVQEPVHAHHIPTWRRLPLAESSLEAGTEPESAGLIPRRGARPRQLAPVGRAPGWRRHQSCAGVVAQQVLPPASRGQHADQHTK
mmetsp:Transcript_62226/g.166702  ORF Transcript_62226/g.166702 Transcript_62226/m.166702 type:complete len:912 (-) Transcript_62226:46-2781(-)